MTRSMMFRSGAGLIAGAAMILIAAVPIGAARAAEPAWTLVPAESKLSYGSIKKDSVGEVNHFTGLTGGVAADGTVSVEIDLTTVETWIDIRNERMLAWVFQGDNPSATIRATVDMARLQGLAPGATDVVDITGTLSLFGTDVPLETGMLVARLAEDRVLVATDEMVFVSTDAVGLDAGVTKLLEIAKLPSITRTVPVTVRFVFQAGAGAATAATAATPVATADSGGDPVAGKKVFRKCQACHVVDQDRNRVGPHLVGIFGRTAGAVDGFKYSKAMAGSGIVWDETTIAAYLRNPKKYIPGNRMAFAGLKKEADIANVLAYLKDATR